MRRLVKVMAFVAAVAAPNMSWADNTTAANADFVMLGEIRASTLSNTVPVRWFKVRLVAGRSYSASAWAPTTDPSETPVSLGIAWFLNDGTTAAAGTNDAQVEPIPDTTDHNGDAESIIPTLLQCADVTGCTFRVSVTATGATSTFALNLMIVETTMVSPYWQVTTGYDAAPQIRNNTSSTITVQFTAYHFGGNVACSNPIPIPANGMVTFGIKGGTPGCNIANGFGSAQIAHHGPPGSVAANITTFSGAAGLSFDAPFYPRNTWTSLGAN